jgi:hypothetical protein
MKPGRNDPCPCGSGKKYKHCCAREDATAAPMLRVVGRDTRSEVEALVEQAIRLPVPWEADVTPVPVRIETDPSARGAAVMLIAQGIILSSELEMHPPSDAEGVATLLVQAMDKVLARGGAAPSMISVRHRDVATQFGLLLKKRGEIEVIASPQLPMLDEFAVSLRQHLSGQTIPLPAVSNPEMWAAWDLPADTLHDLFAAAATFYVAAPWRLLANEDILELVMPNGSRWFACILGAGGEEYALALYESLDDFLSFITASDSSAAFAAQHSAVISLSFDARADLPKPMRREITAAGWPVAGPSAYPNVWALNTIGGGFSETQALDMVMALGVVTRFASDLDRAHAEAVAAMETPWVDEPSGSTVRFALAPEEAFLWDVPVLLSFSLAEGERADASARAVGDEYDEKQFAEDAELVARFVAHAGRAGADEKRVTSDRHNVDLFVQLMHGSQGVRLPAVTELDLRIFLYDLLPRKAMCSKTMANAIRSSLKRFFEYLAAHEELRYPWANAILRDKLAFEDRWDTFPGGHWWDAQVGEWMGELNEDLHARVLLPSDELAGLGQFGDMMGIEEATLYDALKREWLIWRDAEVGLGTRTADELRTRLTARQREWEMKSRAELGGRSPNKTIALERRRREKDGR